TRPTKEHPMPRYFSLGSVPPKRHTAHRAQPGYRSEGIYYEEVVSTQGFSRAYSIAYHLRPPTRVRKAEPAGSWPVERVEQPALRHHHLKTGGLPAKGDPARYLNPDGQFRLGAPFGERDLHGPTKLAPIDSESDIAVLIKDGPRLTRYTLANHPFDVVGWDGCVYPFTFNADDFEPITGTVHQPPPIHQTFESAGGFVVCT